MLFIRISITFFFLAVSIIDNLIILTPFKILKMNTRFNFLVQFALIAMFFSFSHYSNAQFRGGASTVSTLGDQGGHGNDEPCFSPSDSVFVDLVMSFETLNVGGAFDDVHGDFQIDLMDFDFGCNLFVGVTSNTTNHTSYISLSNVETVDLNTENVAFLGNTVNERIALLEIALPTPKLETDCISGKRFEKQIFTLDLYCFDGNEYSPLDPCDYDDFFFEEFLDDNCSLAYEVEVSICCLNLDEEGSGDIRNGLISAIDEEVNALLINKNNLLVTNFDVNGKGENIQSNSAFQLAKYNIYDTRGSLIFSGEKLLNQDEQVEIEIAHLNQGIYICRIVIEDALIVSTRFVKM